MQAPEEDQLSPYAGLSRKIRGEKSASAVEYENRPPSLSVTRRTDAGLPGKFRIFNVLGALISSYSFRVELDGQVVGDLRQGDTLRLEVAPGEHAIRITTPLASSEKITLEVQNGHQVRFSCLASLTGIILQREDV